MPELPEVEVVKRIVDGAVLHKRVRSVRILDSLLLKGLSPRRFSAVVSGRRIVGSRRYGKFLGIELDRGTWIIFHFGMTGTLTLVEQQQDPPECTKLVVELDGGLCVAYISQRKLGMITAVDDFDTFIKSKRLGPDAVEIDASTCQARLRNRRGTVKSKLMNQSIIAGIGNIYSDEILFQARIRPNRQTNSLSNAELRTVCRSLHRVLRIAVERHADPDQMPRSWMLPRRKKGGRCPHCRQQFIIVRMAGRNAYYCPTCQS